MPPRFNPYAKDGRDDKSIKKQKDKKDGDDRKPK
jgi:hypothetical protein